MIVKGSRRSAAGSRPITFVLVHGAWHGGWCWARVADRLLSLGHSVLAPTLTGLADRSHLLDPSITLDTHIEDIVNLLTWNDVENAVLVGHSYGGWPVSGAAERLEDRLRSIVFLDAFLPEAGQKGLDLASSSSRMAVNRALAEGRISRPPPPVSTFRIKSAQDEAWVAAKLTDQPLAVSLQPIVLTGARDRVARKAYIRAANYPSHAFDRAYETCKRTPGWMTVSLSDCGHDAMIDAPHYLADILIAAA